MPPALDADFRDLRIRGEYGGKVRVIELSRPQARNAYTESMRSELCDALDAASRDPVVRAVIITGDPRGGMFCPGLDLNDGAGPKAVHGAIPGDIPAGRRGPQYARDGGGIGGLAVIRCTKPVIAALNGSAVGVGMTLPLCCDMSVAEEDAKVGFVFGKRGLMMECLSSTMLSRHVGHKKALELVLTARVFRARDAPPGLFNYVVPNGGALAKAMELAKEVCATSPISAMVNRFEIIRNFGASPEEAHLVESRNNIAASRASADSKEGFASFLEKRAPEWRSDPFRDAPTSVPWWTEISTKARL